MMESIKHKKKEEERILHLLSPDEDIPLRIGRGENCEIMIDEGVISQVHSSVVLEDNEFILKDKQSKYGTFVKF